MVFRNTFRVVEIKDKKSGIFQKKKGLKIGFQKICHPHYTQTYTFFKRSETAQHKIHTRFFFDFYYIK